MKSIDLSNEVWKQVNGGYRVPYDASIPIQKLEASQDADEIKAIWQELWNELHHQGDVDIASYLALPQIIRIAKRKTLDPVEVLSICGTIEQQRHLGQNPELPTQFNSYYQQGLESLKQYALALLKDGIKGDAQTLALSTIATCSGRVRLGKALLELCDEYVLEEFLNQF